MDKKFNLEIGDWVDIGYRYAKVLCVSSDGYVDVSEVYDEISIGCLKPIPITPEILEKNGFEFNNRGAFVYNGIVRVYFLNDDTIDNTIVDYGDTYLDIELTYVHELQHALRLCNIDKEIEL